MQIYDGNDIVGKGYYCGTELPSVVTFHSRVSYLDFVSNDVVNRSGFKAKYVQIKGMFEVSFTFLFSFRTTFIKTTTEKDNEEIDK